MERQAESREDQRASEGGRAGVYPEYRSAETVFTRLVQIRAQDGTCGEFVKAAEFSGKSPVQR